MTAKSKTSLGSVFITRSMTDRDRSSVIGLTMIELDLRGRMDRQTAVRGGSWFALGTLLI